MVCIQLLFIEYICPLAENIHKQIFHRACEAKQPNRCCRVLIRLPTTAYFCVSARWFQLCMSAWYAWFFINYSLSFFCFSDFYQKVLHILHRTIGWAVFAYTKGAPDMHLYAHKNKKSRGFLLGSWHLSDVLLWFLQLSRNGLLSSTVLHVLLYRDELL